MNRSVDKKVALFQPFGSSNEISNYSRSSSDTASHGPAQGQFVSSQARSIQRGQSTLAADDSIVRISTF